MERLTGCIREVDKVTSGSATKRAWLVQIQRTPGLADTLFSNSRTNRKQALQQAVKESTCLKALVHRAAIHQSAALHDIIDEVRLPQSCILLSLHGKDRHNTRLFLDAYTIYQVCPAGSPYNVETVQGSMHVYSVQGV